jgi:hypothetical protein
MIGLRGWGPDIFYAYEVEFRLNMKLSCPTVIFVEMLNATETHQTDGLTKTFECKPARMKLSFLRPMIHVGDGISDVTSFTNA